MDIQFQLNEIKAGLDKYGYNELNPTEIGYHYADILYPLEALKILTYSRSKKWPGYNIDKILDRILSTWLKTHASDQHAYITALFEAINRRECLDGVIARLNLVAVAEPTQDVIKVNGVSYSSTTQQYTALAGETRYNVTEFLKHYDKFHDINTVYRTLKTQFEEYDLEQALLCWMGYLAARSIAERSMLRLENNAIRSIGFGSVMDVYRR